MAVDMVCEQCGGKTVTRDAWAEWNVEEQDWVVGAVYDHAYCHDCDDSTRIEEVEISAERAAPELPTPD